MKNITVIFIFQKMINKNTKILKKFQESRVNKNKYKKIKNTKYNQKNIFYSGFLK